MQQVDLSALRQALHRIPEPAFQEQQTKALLLSYLKPLQGIIIHQFEQSPALLVEYTHGTGDYLLFRADMDGLPIGEETGCDFMSLQAGMMHACGHDIHMTVLLGTIWEVCQSQPAANLLFLFQPAEEGQGGAQSVLAEGILQRFSIRHAFALHVTGKLPLNSVSSKAGIIFANTQEFDVEFFGQAAHVAFPEQGHNALAAAVSFYHRFRQEMETLAASEPCLHNIGLCQAGTIRNIIPDYCRLEGTHRSLDRGLREHINSRLADLAQTAAGEQNCTAKVSLLCSYDLVVNAANLYERLVAVCDKTGIDFVEARTTMTGEDFGFFSALYPSLLFWLGGNDPQHDLHSSRFLPDSACIRTGVQIFTQLISSF